VHSQGLLLGSRHTRHTQIAPLCDEKGPIFSYRRHPHQGAQLVNRECAEIHIDADLMGAEIQHMLCSLGQHLCAVHTHVYMDVLGTTQAEDCEPTCSPGSGKPRPPNEEQ
jgi:hypothetical protein